jgi:hypothetical protein
VLIVIFKKRDNHKRCLSMDCVLIAQLLSGLHLLPARLEPNGSLRRAPHSPEQGCKGKYRWSSRTTD